MNRTIFHRLHIKPLRVKQHQVVLIWIYIHKKKNLLNLRAHKLFLLCLKWQQLICQVTLRRRSKPVLHLHSLHAVQVHDGQDDGHQEDDDAAHAHADVEHLGGGGGRGHSADCWRQDMHLREAMPGDKTENKLAFRAAGTQWQYNNMWRWHKEL